MLLHTNTSNCYSRTKPGRWQTQAHSGTRMLSALSPTHSAIQKSLKARGVFYHSDKWTSRETFVNPVGQRTGPNPPSLCPSLCWDDIIRSIAGNLLHITWKCFWTVCSLSVPDLSLKQKRDQKGLKGNLHPTSSPSNSIVIKVQLILKPKDLTPNVITSFYLSKTKTY